MAEYTKQTYDDLEEALQNAIREHKEAQLRIGTITEGDANVWHDNFAFEEANREEQRMRGEVARLSRLVADATIVERPEDADASVRLGSHVTIRIAGKEANYFIGGDTNFKNATKDGVALLSTKSPIGTALIGHSAGDVVSYKLPGGRHREAEIVRVW